MTWVDLKLFYGKVKLHRLCLFTGKTVTKSLNGEKLAANDYINRIFIFFKTFDPRGLPAPAPELYTFYNRHLHCLTYFSPKRLAR